MKFILEISCDNAAFSDNADLEIARILHHLANNLENDRHQNTLRDSNGNVVGGFEFSDEPPNCGF